LTVVSASGTGGGSDAGADVNADDSGSGTTSGEAFGGRIAGSGLAISRTWLRFIPLAKKLYAPIA
jgi:hypothetical protein